MSIRLVRSRMGMPAQLSRIFDKTPVSERTQGNLHFFIAARSVLTVNRVIRCPHLP